MFSFPISDHSKFWCIFLLICCSFFGISAQKTVYVPSFIANSGMDINNPNSQWSFARSVQSENVVIFWEPGFGNDPSTLPEPYKVDMETLLATLESSFLYYLDTLKFAEKGSSVTDQYKLMAFLLYTQDWAAFGSGQDDLVGSLFVSPGAANLNDVVAHEVGHCFQYITGCDTEGGFRYGLGENGAGGNGFWEQCAQWMAYKLYPELQFEGGDFFYYTQVNHLHVLHEAPRYANYFLPDYWTYKHGKDFTGRLWRESRFPEDPLEAYKRITNISQKTLNDEMYEHAARLTTWDLPELRSLGQPFINARNQVKMNPSNDGFWEIDPSVCIENYGYSSIKLEVPQGVVEMKVEFVGKAGETGYRSKNIDQAGWRFGFVALLENGERVYSDMASAEYQNGTNPEVSLRFTCPENCDKLWLVVSGAPQTHWKHEWDDNNENDEQWPYKVKFENTGLLQPSSGPLSDITLTYDIEMSPASDYIPVRIQLDAQEIADAFGAQDINVFQLLGSDITYYAINSDGTLDSVSTAIPPGHWYDKNGNVINWGSNAYMYCELEVNQLIAKIGQYPDRCMEGDSFTVRQVLKYTRNQTEKAWVTLIYNVYIKDNTTSTDQQVLMTDIPSPNPTSGFVSWKHPSSWKLYNVMGDLITSGKGNHLDMSGYPQGMYMLFKDNKGYKIFR